MRVFLCYECPLFLTLVIFSASSILISPAAHSASQFGAPLPNERIAQTMVYETMIAINNAMMTNNYSVLHAMGAPDFQKRYKIKELAKTFAGLRAKNVDLKPVLLLKPEILKTLYLSERKIFRLKGYMPTAPVRLYFDFHYQHVGAHWKLFALNLKFNRPMVTGDVTTAR